MNCPALVHDSLTAYVRHGCRCPEALAAKAASMRRYASGQQAHTARHARAFAMPWTPSDDDELANGTGPLTERANRIGRTYYAARARLAFLRDQESAVQT